MSVAGLPAKIIVQVGLITDLVDTHSTGNPQIRLAPMRTVTKCFGAHSCQW